jgi:DNA-binding NtrC family response regulator
MSETLRIVLVHDYPADQDFVIRELCREFPALEVIQVGDHDSFSRVLAAQSFDLVITDYQLPWTTGLAILQAVKQSMPGCPVIMFTGTSSVEIVVAAMKGGLDDYVLKSPGHSARLPGAVRSALERTRQHHMRQAEAGIERPRERLDSNEKLDTVEPLLAGIAHEFNNPLSVILGHAAILHQVLADTPNAERAEKIVQAAEQCVQIVNNVAALTQRPPDQMHTAVQKREPGAEKPLGEGRAAVVARSARILVVDDEPGIAGVLAEVLQLDGHVVETVGNGEAALEKLANGGYELILSDIRMPDLDGPTLYHEVERRHPDLLPRFIFLTGDIMSPETSQFLSETTVPCLSKPFTLETVRQVVQRALTETSER